MHIRKADGRIRRVDDRVPNGQAGGGGGDEAGGAEKMTTGEVRPRPQ